MYITSIQMKKYDNCENISRLSHVTVAGVVDMELTEYIIACLNALNY